jgi:excisionase family DNA binding protein
VDFVENTLTLNQPTIKVETSPAPVIRDVMTFEQAMEMLQVGKDALRSLIRNRKIQFVKIGIRYRFRREWIIKFLERG